MRPLFTEFHRIGMRQGLATLNKDEQPEINVRVKRSKLRPKEKITDKIPVNKKAPEESPEKTIKTPQMTNLNSSKTELDEEKTKTRKIQTKTEKPPRMHILDRLFIKPPSERIFEFPVSNVSLEVTKRKADPALPQNNTYFKQKDITCNSPASNVSVESTDRLLPKKIEAKQKNTKKISTDKLISKTALLNSPISNITLEDTIQEIEKAVPQNKIQSRQKNSKKITTTDKLTEKEGNKAGPQIEQQIKNTKENSETDNINFEYDKSPRKKLTEGTLLKRQKALEKWRQMGRKRNDSERRRRERRIRKINKY